jgi:hypothetical protein
MILGRARFVSAVTLAALFCVATRAGAQSPSAPARDTITKEYRGAYQRGFEQSWFAPCDAEPDDKLWWVTLTDEALAKRDSMLAKVTAPATTGLAVRWRATTSPRMPAGQMGRGTRYMLVTKIEEIWPLPAEGACVKRPATS